MLLSNIGPNLSWRGIQDHNTLISFYLIPTSWDISTSVIQMYLSVIRVCPVLGFISLERDRMVRIQTKGSSEGEKKHFIRERRT